ncbi:MAG: TIGR00341 family protein [Saprospirales bacterium]|nr:TIGR00341 family protein [Saprospirales bacterium]
MEKIFTATWEFLKDRFNLSRDQEKEDQIIDEIEKSVEFRGVNVWILIFAIMVASVGLNVNSTPVVIGAMLISPLMGPIMGVGLALGITDSDLLKKSAKNLAVMVGISIVTSAIYFWLSPLNDENSELLGRTAPTIWDVFIGFFGGMAGIVATASKEKGNVIPGVAIATALMPPLCTAGFGIATGNPAYFFGAFYLFSINATFICLSTLLLVRFLKFREREFVSPEARRKVRLLIWTVVVIIILPSLYVARQLVQNNLFEQRVHAFLEKEFNFPETDILKYEYGTSPERYIEVTLIGEPLDSNTISNLEHSLLNYELTKTKLVIKQGTAHFDPNEIKSTVLEEVLTRHLDTLRSRDEKIKVLTQELIKAKGRILPVNQLSKEAAAIDPEVKGLALGLMPLCDAAGICPDTLHLAYVQYRRLPKEEEKQRMQQWLKTRLNCDSVLVIPGQ